jgi:ABC-type glycerol-3-phosphate transport system permease component
MTALTQRRRSLPVRVVAYVISVFFAIFVLFPLAWALLTSFKTDAEIQSSPPDWFPVTWVVDNYVRVVTASPLPQYLLNTAIVAVVGTLVTLIIAVHAAYAITRFRFRGRDAGSFILLVTIMVPTVSIILPQFIIASQLSLVDTRTVLVIIDSAWQIPLAVWIMRAYFYRVSPEIDEAAMLDGCSRLTAFYRVVVPISWPGILAAAVVVFIWIWNEFLIGLTLATSVKAQPVAPGLYSYITESGIDWGTLTAAAMIAMVPVIVVFIVLQRQFVEGLTSGTGK